MAQRDNDQRYPIFGDPPFYNVPFSRMHERTKTRGVTLVYFSVWTFFEQSCINISLVSLVWREIYSFHPSNIVFIVANTLKYAINKLLIFTSFTRYKYKFVFNLFYLISLLLSNCLPNSDYTYINKETEQNGRSTTRFRIIALQKRIVSPRDRVFFSLEILIP